MSWKSRPLGEPVECTSVVSIERRGDKWFVFKTEEGPSNYLFATPWDPSPLLGDLLRVYEHGHNQGESNGWESHRDQVIEAIGLDSVFEWHEDRMTTLEKAAASRVRADALGFVYLVYCSALKHFKIGFSIHPTKRAVEVEKMVGHPVRIVCSIPTLDMRALETSLHAKYAARRAQGEWFDLTGAEVEEIVALSRAES